MRLGLYSLLRSAALLEKSRGEPAACLGSQDLYSVAPPFYGGLVSLHASQGWACGVRPDGRATCWSIFSLDQPPQDQFFLEVVGGENVGCGIKPDHRVYCWGESNNYGFPEEQ